MEPRYGGWTKPMVDQVKDAVAEIELTPGIAATHGYSNRFMPKPEDLAWRKKRVSPDIKSLVYRELTAAEATALPHLAWTGPHIETGTFSVFGAVTLEGKVVATQGVMQMMHWEGFWIERHYRGIPELQRKLSAEVHDLLRSLGASAAFTIALDNQPSVVKAIESQGGTYVGRLYVIHTRKE